MKKLAMLLLVLALCLPSYGDILVYKVSIAGRAIDIEDDVAYIGSGTIKGYLVVDVNTADAEDPVITDDALVVYGKDDDGDKVQVNVGSVIDDDDGYSQNEMEQAGRWAVGIEAESDGIGGLVLIGKAKLVDIGFGKADKKIVAKSLTGHGVLWTDPISGIELVGSGKITATLKTNWTKDYNESEETFDDALADMQEVKLADYEDITP